MKIRARIALSAILAVALCISACMNEYNADDEMGRPSTYTPDGRGVRGIGTSPSASGIGASPSAQDAGLPDAAVK